METILIGIGSSIIAEVVAWLNKKFSGTFLDGKGAFVFTFAVSVSGALISMAIKHETIDWKNLSATFSQIFAYSQIFFQFVIKNFNLDIKKTQTGVSTPPIQ